MILWFAEKIYGIASKGYHHRWDIRGGWRAPIPVISVGNLTVGGNGKTPFVIALVKLLQEHFPALREQNRIAVLSRGYGRKSKQLVIVESDSNWQESGDEPLLIKRTCPSALVISNAKRVDSAKVAHEKFGAKLIILDDGFQHRAIARDIDLVLLDSEKPLGNGHMLPAGALREPIDALKRASAFVSLGHGDAVEPLAQRFGKPLFRLQSADIPVDWKQRLQQRPFLLTGIARPERVLERLEAEGVNIAGHRAFRDHHEFSLEELLSVEKQAVRDAANCILVTPKDMVRISAWKGRLPLFEIPYSLDILDRLGLLDYISSKLGSSFASE